MWFWILGWFFIILALLGNSLVVFLVTFKRNLRTKTNWFIVSLAVADFFAALAFFPPRYISNFYYEIDLTHAGLWYKICFTFLYSSTTNLCVLTVDRYIAIVLPLKYASFRQAKISIYLIPLAWFTTLIFFTLPASLSYRGNETFTLVFEISRVFIFQVFPSIFFALVACRLIYIANKLSHQCTALEAQVRYNYAFRQTAATRKIYRPERKAAVMIILIITVFNVTYACGTYFCYCFIAKTCDVPATLKKIIYLLFIVNVTANPVVYAFFKKDIRENLRKLIPGNSYADPRRFMDQ